jgi:hypothetical protein
MTEKNYTCPHCNEALDCWEPCPETGWDHNLYVCNNDACPYFTCGREKIARECHANFAYRYCYDPEKGKEMPVVAWCGGDRSLLKGRAEAGKKGA